MRENVKERLNEESKWRLAYLIPKEIEDLEQTDRVIL